MQAPPTAELLERVKRGSPDAINALYERYGPRLLSFIRLRLGRELRARLESRDILQSALLKSLEHLEDFRGDEARSVMAWLARIAEHEIRDRADYYQRLRRDAAREVPLEPETPVAAASRSALTRVIFGEERARLEEAIESLSDEHREVIVLRKFQELSFAEISRRMGRSEDACRMLLARAMAALTLRLAASAR